MAISGEAEFRDLFGDQFMSLAVVVHAVLADIRRIIRHRGKGAANVEEGDAVFTGDLADGVVIIPVPAEDVIDVSQPFEYVIGIVAL